MKSDQYATRGIELLRGKGWPEDAIKTVMGYFMQAGYWLRIEQEQDEAQRNEALIQRAVQR